MDRVVVSVAIAAVLVSAAPASSESQPASAPATNGISIIQTKDHAELNQKWCAADPNIEHIFVLPASLFVDSEQLICDSGPYKLYRLIEHDDTDDFEYSSIRRPTGRKIASVAMERPGEACRRSPSTAGR